MELSTHPNPQPNPYHRKIELQSPLDLDYLQSNVLRAAREKLALHFPLHASQPAPAPATHIPLDGPNGAGDQPDISSNSPMSTKAAPSIEADPMRARVQSLVEAFVMQTWSNAQHSISINGIDATELPSHSFLPTSSTTLPPSSTSNDKFGEREGVDFVYSTYDTELQKKVAALYTELEGLTAKVSRLRRDAPAKAATTYGASLEAALSEEAEMERQMRDHSTKQQEVENALNLQTEAWNDDVAIMYERGLAELRRLSGIAINSTSTSTGGEKNAGSDEGDNSNHHHSEARPSLTETIGKAQRARTVAMELE